MVISAIVIEHAGCAVCCRCRNNNSNNENLAGLTEFVRALCWSHAKAVSQRTPRDGVLLCLTGCRLRL